MVVTVDRHANTSAASIPLALDEAVRDGRIRAGHHVMMLGVGGGFTWGSALVRWSDVDDTTDDDVAVVFPGQGSQSVGMMAGWDDHPVVRATFDEASEALGDDLWALVTDGPAEALNLTTNTQPVMLAAGVAAWRAWRAAGGATPAVLAGHSLGEYSALVAAGALAFRDAVPLVRFRAQAMQDAVPAGVGAMAAILGGDDAAIARSVPRGRARRGRRAGELQLARARS